MKAMVYTEYGPPEVLSLKELAAPVPGDSEVLIQVQAASVNSWDWDLVRGKPLWARLWGLFRPNYTIPGADVAGIVEAVGRDVTRFKPGDEVFGDLCECGWGSFAGFVCASEDALAPKPPGMTFVQAAALPQAGVIALQCLRDKRHVRQGDRVLINGAGGGVGTFAIQMAKHFGAGVTAVDSGEKLEIMRSIGADHVIDYMKEDFTRNGEQYDLIIDLVAKRSIFDYRRALCPGGMCVFVGGSVSRLFQFLLVGPVLSLAGRRKFGILAHKPNSGLTEIIELFSAGKVLPVIDKRFPLHELPDALRYLGEGHVQGKVIILPE